VDDSALGEKDRTLAQRLELPLLRGGFDVADLSGKHSRIVQARVLKRTVL